MGITNYSWGPELQNEALKCWFYGIAWSIVLSLYQLTGLHATSPASTSLASKKPIEKRAKQTAAKKKSSLTSADRAFRSRIYTQLVIDCCDIFIPGSAVGWIPVYQVFAGTCQTISSAVAAKQVWDRVRVSS